MNPETTTDDEDSRVDNDRFHVVKAGRALKRKVKKNKTRKDTGTLDGQPHTQERRKVISPMGLINVDIKVSGRRTAKTAAIAIKNSRENFNYGEALRKARKEISVADLGIEVSRVRPALSGGIVIKISGESGAAKTDHLATKFRVVLVNKMSVSRPVKKREVFIRGIDNSITAKKVVSQVAELSGCATMDIKARNLKPMRNL